MNKLINAEHEGKKDNVEFEWKITGMFRGAMEREAP